MTGKDAPTPYGARTLASIVLIFNHPSLSHPEATVRTCFAGQSRNLWNVGGHGLGIFGLDRLFQTCLWYRGRARRNLRPTGTALRFSLGVNRGSSETETAPNRDRPATLVSGGSSAACPGRNCPDITFQGAPFEAWHVGTWPCRCALTGWDVSPAKLMHACGGREKRRELALQIFHLVGSGRRLFFFAPWSSA